MSLLLDIYGELLTEKQRGFLRRYYEEDNSFGEIAREFHVSRQAIFDAVKHGEASLEHYESVLGLVTGGGRGNGITPEAANRLSDCISRLRALPSAGPNSGPAAREIDAIARELETLRAELAPKDSVPPSSPEDEETEDQAEPNSPEAPSGRVFLRGGGPEVD